MMMTAKTLLAAVLTASAAAELKLDLFENNAISGTPNTTSTVPSLDFQVAMRGSAEVTGTLTYDETSLYAFDCAFGGGQIVFVWVNDHLVCHTNPPFGNTPSSTDGSPEYRRAAFEPASISRFRVSTD